MDPSLVKEWFPLAKESSAAFAAVFFALTSFGLLTALIATLIRAGRNQALMSKAHSAKIDEIHQRELKRFGRLESVAHGLLQMVDAGAIEVRRGKSARREPKTNPAGRILDPAATLAPEQLQSRKEDEDAG